MKFYPNAERDHAGAATTTREASDERRPIFATNRIGF
jgi:hypothetical protein